MSTIRYTAGGDYDAANSADITPAAGPLDNLAAANGGFYAGSGSGVELLPDVRTETDGIFADFSDTGNYVFMNGGALGDVLIGGSIGGELNGGGGDDVLEGGAGADAFDGGDGYDIVSYEHASASVTVSNVINGSGDASGDTFTSVDEFRGSAGNDTFVLQGFYTVEGGAGADTIIGGGGFIAASYEHSLAGVNVDLSGKLANTGGDAEGDTLNGVSFVAGSIFQDRLTGTAGFNVLIGGDGNDVLKGGGGNDTLGGFEGADQLRGGVGDDVLIGGEGRDFLRGGHGADTFAYETADGARDVIRDFSGHNGEGDDINLAGLGNLTFVETFTVDGSGEVRAFTNAAGSQIVLVDADGDGAADLSIRVDTTEALTADDFVFGSSLPPSSSAAVNTGAFNAASEHTTSTHFFAEALHPHDMAVLV